eukprot:g10769.t1
MDPSTASTAQHMNVSTANMQIARPDKRTGRMLWLTGGSTPSNLISETVRPLVLRSSGPQIRRRRIEDRASGYE